jgi:hypothetical protein
MKMNEYLNKIFINGYVKSDYVALTHKENLIIKGIFKIGRRFRKGYIGKTTNGRTIAVSIRSRNIVITDINTGMMIDAFCYDMLKITNTFADYLKFDKEFFEHREAETRKRFKVLNGKKEIVMEV